jgi:predicted nuclease of predicted toxin-antitoxin system
VRFFFDNQHPPEIVHTLREAGKEVVHLREEFSDRGIDDVIWIPEIARRGWVLITGDHRIRTRKSEKVVFQRNKLVAFFMGKDYNNKRSHTRVEWVLGQWLHIETAAATAQPGDCFLVPMKGKLRKLGDE